MAHPNWDEIEPAIEAVLNLPEDERQPFLAQQPATIREEVESLLAAYRRSGTFLGQISAASAAPPEVLVRIESLLAHAYAGSQPGGSPAELARPPASGVISRPAATGTQLGAYWIEDVLGEGGMGVVYRAFDTKLNRPVAVKFLFDDLADAAARRRFQREAQMASALNHPHILTVHDAGEFEGRQYLVTELIDGGTLRDWARRERPTWRQVAEILVGVADGLAAAHTAGILHRDIKPANILVGTNGYAKLADFGLAKLSQPQPQRTDGTTQTLFQDSRPGMILGTVAYMSPEQASGRLVDSRSDIFSFGVMMYELLAGRRPFEGDTDLQVLQQIIHGSPPPLDAAIPVALRALIEKALEKDPPDRYQSMREMVVDLRRLARQTGESSQAPVTRPTQRERWRRALSALFAAVLIMACVLVFLRFRQPAGHPGLQYTQLTNFADSATSPALSPDGRMLAFIRGESTFYGPGQIYVKQLPNGEPVRLTHDDMDKMWPKFSPDGATIAYTARRDSNWDTWLVPVLGKNPRPFLTNAEGLTWIDTGAGQPHILFSELTFRGVQMSIVTSTESRTGQRTIYLPPETGMAHRSYLSPDRKSVLIVEMNSGTWLPCRVVPFDGNSPGEQVGPSPAQCTDAAWSKDGNWMYFSANSGSGYHIWRQRYPDGVVEQITLGATDEQGIHFDPDGHSFVTSVGTSQSTVWIHDSRGDRQITSEGFAVLPSIAPDARKLYYLVRSGGAHNFLSGELWVADLESGQSQRLLPNFLMRHYSISADGSRVVFVASDDTGRTPVWVAALDGSSAPRRIAEKDAWTAFFGANGHVVFAGNEKDGLFVWRVKEVGGELTKALSVPVLYLFSASPDGEWVVAGAPTKDATYAVFAYPADGGHPRLICPSCWRGHGIERGPEPPVLSWSRDGKLVYLFFEGSAYSIPLQSGQMLPPIPLSGIRSKEDIEALPGARLIGAGAFPGPAAALYAFTRFSFHRNIYRVRLP